MTDEVAQNPGTFDLYFPAKDESLGACAQTRVRRRMFSAFLSYGGVSCSEVRPQKIPIFFFALMRCLVKFVVL